MNEAAPKPVEMLESCPSYLMNGKGSKRRRRQISREEFERKWDELFPPKKDS